MFLLQAKTITTALMTYVVSASISNMSIQNLADPVIIILKHIQENWVIYLFSSGNQTGPLCGFPVKKRSINIQSKDFMRIFLTPVSRSML